MHLVGLEAKGGEISLALVSGDCDHKISQCVGVKDKNDQEQRTCVKLPNSPQR